MLRCLALSAAVLVVSAACSSTDALKQRCLEGDTSACERACAKGVPGEGGCFDAGEQHRRRAGGDPSSPDWKKAEESFERSCKARHAEGCLLAAEMIEAPHVSLEPSAKGAPSVIGDAALAERDVRLATACDLGAARACQRLGDTLIGKSRERAVRAYEKACDVGALPAECRAARAREVEQADRWSLACRSGVADDCTRLGDLLYTVDAPRALKLFVTECQLRGVEAYAGGMAAFLSDRVKRVRPGLALPPPVAPPEDPSSPRVELTSGLIEGSVAAVEVDRVLRLLRPSLSACVAKAPPGSLSLRLVVDRTGDVFRAEVLEDHLAPAATSCVVAALETAAFTPPLGGLAKVSVSLRVVAAAPPPPTRGP